MNNENNFEQRKKEFYFQQRKKQFDMLPKYKKRIEIARDTLAQLKSRRIYPKQNVWLTLNKAYGLLTLSQHYNYGMGDTQAQEIIDGQKCTACALGGMLACMINRTDNVTLRELSDGQFIGSVYTEPVFRYLGTVFSRKQLNLIEAAFEQRSQGINDDIDTTAGKLFTKGIRSARVRMRLIMENIIVNNGTFKPEQLPKAKTTYFTPGFKE